jgi:hypothetical protein
MKPIERRIMPTHILFRQAFVWGFGASCGQLCFNTLAKIVTPVVKKATEELEKKRSTEK